MAALRCLCMLVLVSLCLGETPTVPPKYVVDLDLTEEQRWTHVVKDYPELPEMIQTVIKKYVPDDLVSMVEQIGSAIDDYLPSPYAGEIRGIAKALNMTLGEAVIPNILYDLTSFCTSIVAQDLSGNIWHARNLDYSFTDMLRNITIIVDFQRQGKIVYSGVTYAGYVGLLSVQKPGAFTITADERDKGAWWMNLLIGIFDKQAKPMSFLVRDTTEQAEDFQSAVRQLSYTVTEASVYYIIGGVKKGEGAVITKERLSALDTWYIDSTVGRWFVLETNYDHWVTPPTSDDRRDPGIKAMNAMGNKTITVNSLFKVLSTQPVLNPTTTYSVVMSAGQPDLLTAWVRHLAH
ncbi:N-acylethanolamine-hydrolyzing acid amidase-like [Liolophura sinensis]|uniref:N-acylethanolamine-hydrolyzing acid amidase-like n=1 Tax=Liolophura sinensis TaxID=3198878 RepID=UPI0031581F28